MAISSYLDHVEVCVPLVARPTRDESVAVSLFGRTAGGLQKNTEQNEWDVFDLVLKVGVGIFTEDPTDDMTRANLGENEVNVNTYRVFVSGAVFALVHLLGRSHVRRPKQTPGHGTGLGRRRSRGPEEGSGSLGRSPQHATFKLHLVGRGRGGQQTGRAGH